MILNIKKQSFLKVTFINNFMDFFPHMWEVEVPSLTSTIFIHFIYQALQWQINILK